MKIPELLDKLEGHYGPQQPTWPTEPYDFIVWWHCGYPASDKSCARGWVALQENVGIAPEMLLKARPARLTEALREGGMVPELRALRLKEIAARVQDQLGGDLRAAITGPIGKARKELVKFPNIAGPGSDRILLFAGIAPVAAVPSNCPHVLVRILHGQEHENYNTTYKEAQVAIEAHVPATIEARSRAYLLLKRHGQETCKRNPKCEQCPVNKQCAFFAGKKRGRHASA
jgi:endonuclease III related protein